MLSDREAVGRRTVTTFIISLLVTLLLTAGNTARTPLITGKTVLDRGQTDRVTTPTRAILRRWRWHRTRHAARLVVLGDVTIKTYSYTVL